MPHDPVIEHQTVLEKSTHGGNDRVLVRSYEADANADGSIAFDPFKDFDEWAEREVMRVLEQHYPGHFWSVKHLSRQGMCLISIPILMGINRYMAVNLKTHALDSVRVIKAGGEILERYGLIRGGFQLDTFLEAREKHSALVVPGREVPG